MNVPHGDEGSGTVWRGGVAHGCVEHRNVIDGLFLEGRPVCGQCAARAVGWKPWFFTGSPHAHEIIASLEAK